MQPIQTLQGCRWRSACRTRYESYRLSAVPRSDSPIKVLEELADCSISNASHPLQRITYNLWFATPSSKVQRRRTEWSAGFATHRFWHRQTVSRRDSQTLASGI